MMRASQSSIVLVLAGISAYAGSLNLMPMPERVAAQPGSLTIDAAFTAALPGYSDRKLEAGVDRFLERIARQTGLPIAASPSKAERATLVIVCRGAGSADESYQLDVSTTGARLTAPATIGILHGLETFLQLVAPGDDAFSVPGVRIDDRPRFPWRGFMLDVSRHWMPIPVIERNLDAMAAVKLNVFHWHLSDDQGFRVESKLFPKLQQLGSDGNFYTQDEVRHTIAYAAERGIRVIPEFDMPGHTTAWFVGYPELASAPGPYRIERRWGIFEPTLDPTREEVYSFLDKLIGEMSALFPDEYFHVGGDEVRDKQWKENPAIQAFCAKNGLAASQDLQAYFNRRVQALLKKHGKKMIGWDEVLQPGLPHDLIVQSWRGPASLAEAARKGYRGILSFGYYLDHLDTAAFSYRIDPQGGEAQALSGKEAASILGGEACMWTEYVDTETVDSRIWPRLAAIAERLWSPAKVTDVDSMYRRMAVVSRWLDWSGVEHRANYSRMLERLSGGNSSADLRVLANAVEAEGISVRQEARRYTSQTPLNRLVDAARPESEQIRLLETVVKRFIESPAPPPAERNYLRLTLEQWRDNHAALLPYLQQNFLLRETVPLSEDLSALGTAGLQALEFLDHGSKAPPDWLSASEELLNRTERPRAELILAAGRPIRILVEAAGRGQTAGAAAASSDKQMKTGTFDQVSNGSITRRQLF